MSLRPLFCNFAEAGVEEALERGLASLKARVSDLPALPSWLSEPDFVSARFQADPWSVGNAVVHLRHAERTLRARVAQRAPSMAWPVKEPPGGFEALPAWAADDGEAQKRMVVALGRLALGAAIEAALAEKALDRVTPGERCSRGTDATAARVYHDAFLVSVWTSAHAQYVAYIQQGLEEPPTPSVTTVQNALNEMDLSDLFSRRFCQRQCPKATMPMLQILCRCT